jgi:hypothetical protein
MLPFPDMCDCRGQALLRVTNQIRRAMEHTPCPHCGAVLLRSMKPRFCCHGSEASVRSCLPAPLAPLLLARIVEETEANANFPRTLNCKLRPVLQHASVSAPNGPASTLFIAGILYAVDAFGQFKTTVYAVFCRNEGGNAARPSVVERLIDQVLEANGPLRGYRPPRWTTRSSGDEPRTPSVRRSFLTRCRSETVGSTPVSLVGPSGVP